MKIIGNTVGTPLPKSDWKQTDPTKGDYIKNKPDIDALQNLIGDTSVADQISDAISAIETITPDDIDVICGRVLDDKMYNVLKYGDSLYIKQNISTLQKDAKLAIL